ncbi:hypothetical protein PFISCL1PPCAC_23116, partial [Pristionchus fissidentatus]
FPSAAVITDNDVGRQVSLNLVGTYNAFATYSNRSTSDNAYVQKVRIVTSNNSSTDFSVYNLSSMIDSSGRLTAMNFTAPITIINDNPPTSKATDFVIYFVSVN